MILLLLPQKKGWEQEKIKPLQKIQSVHFRVVQNSKIRICLDCEFLFGFLGIFFPPSFLQSQIIDESCNGFVGL